MMSTTITQPQKKDFAQASEILKTYYKLVDYVDKVFASDIEWRSILNKRIRLTIVDGFTYLKVGYSTPVAVANPKDIFVNYILDVQNTLVMLGFSSDFIFDDSIQFDRITDLGKYLEQLYNETVGKEFK